MMYHHHCITTITFLCLNLPISHNFVHNIPTHYNQISFTISLWPVHCDMKATTLRDWEEEVISIYQEGPEVAVHANNPCRSEVCLANPLYKIYIHTMYLWAFWCVCVWNEDPQEVQHYSGDILHVSMFCWDIFNFQIRCSGL